MHKKGKRPYRKEFRNKFRQIKKHLWYKKIIILPFGVRLIFAIILFPLGVLGVLTPIPGGLIMIIVASALICKLSFVRRNLMKLFFLLRLHKVSIWIKDFLKK